MYSYVKLNFKASLFSCIFWFEDSLLCKIAFLVVPFLLIFCEIEHWKKRPYVDCMTVIKKFSFDFRSRHLPDTLRHHPDTARHPQTPSRHPSDTSIFGLHTATGRKGNIRIPYSTKIRELWGNPPPLPSRFPSTPYLPRFDGAWIGYNKLLLSAVYGLYIVYLYTFNVNCHHSWRGEYPAVLLSICFAFVCIVGELPRGPLQIS